MQPGVPAHDTLQSEDYYGNDTILDSLDALPSEGSEHSGISRKGATVRPGMSNLKGNLDELGMLDAWDLATDRE